MTENEKKTEKVSAYASLTGFHRAVPFILTALAVFTALCFVTRGSDPTQSTGALGKWFADFLLGSFSIAGYGIPVLLGIHAIFYASDIQKGRVISRVIFSLIALIFVSSIIHVIFNFNVDFPYSAKTFYNDGIMQKGGGFVGGSISFLLTKAFGSVGFIIISALVVVLYFVYFFAGGKNAFLKALLRLLDSVGGHFNRVAEKKKAKKDARIAKENEKNDARLAKESEKRERLVEKKEMKEAKLLKTRHEPLEDDDFFATDNGMSELKIKELGISETRSEEDIEADPTLQEKVMHSNSDSSQAHAQSHTAEEKAQESEAPRRRRVNMDYSGFEGGCGYSTSTKSSTYTEADDSIVYDATEGYTAPSGEESADAVFGSEFGAFDFKLEEALRTKQSTGARQSSPKQDEGVCEVVSEIKEEDIERARRRADLEMKKRANEEAERGFVSARDEIEKDMPKPASFIPYTVIDDDVTDAQSSKTDKRFDYDGAYTDKGMGYSESKEEPHKEQQPQEKSLDDRLTLAQERYKRAAEIANRNTGGEADTESVDNGTTKFAPYSTSNAINTVAVEDEVDEPVLKTERSVIFDTARQDTSYAKENAYSSDTLTCEPESDNGTQLDFDGLDGVVEEDFEEEIDMSVPEEEKVGPLGYEEIPEGEQNKDILDFRKMYSVLDGDKNGQDDINNDGEDYSTTEQDIVDSRQTAESHTPSTVIHSKKAEPEEEENDDTLSQKPDYSDYKFPPTDLLLAPKNNLADENSGEEINENADNLVNTLQQFGVRVSVKGVDRGPRITRYEIVPAMGVKVQSVMSLYNDIVLNLGAEGVRMEAPIPGRKAIGVEIPNKNPEIVSLRELVETDTFQQSSSKTVACLGKDVTGKPVFEDIAKMPHVLVAGATGMGKSVCINAVLISILYKATPDDVRLIMIDPKKVEFKRYNGIPHLLIPVVTDVKQAAGALMWAVEQMEKRYSLMEELGVSKLDSYNEIVRQKPELGEPLPKIIIVIDELNDIMIQVRKPSEDLIMSIAQKARAAGIHLIIGTQRPSVNVVTGTIKANIPSRISCKVASFQDSKTILEQSGAEKLLNNGDMLYITSGTPKPVRVQGAFVTDGEVASVMKFLKTQAKGDIYDAQALEEINRAAQKCSKGKGGASDVDDDEDAGDKGTGIFSDPQFLEAVEVAIKAGKVSTSLLQRKIQIGFSKAARYIDAMEGQSIVSAPNGQRPRDVLITLDEWHEILSRRSLD